MPGYGTGRLDVEGNFAAYVDRLVLGAHTWKPGWDPEGPLSTIPAVASTLFGAMAGELLRARDVAGPRSSSALMGAGALGITLGALWGTVFPINKNLWTSSYAVFMAGLAAVCLAVCLWLVDVRGWKGWATPFRWLGANALAIFVAVASGDPDAPLDQAARATTAGAAVALRERSTGRSSTTSPTRGSGRSLFALAFLSVFVALAGAALPKADLHQGRDGESSGRPAY